MAVLIIRHAVGDYAAWRPVYDAHEAAPTAAGLTNGRVFRSTMTRTTSSSCTTRRTGGGPRSSAGQTT